MEKLRNKKSGFSLIELIIVISISTLLGSVVVNELKLPRMKSRDTARVENMRALQTALKNYYDDMGHYPKTFEVGDDPNGGKRGECTGNPTDYIPGLTPQYIQALPSDPALNCAGIAHSWFYASDGVNYKLITHNETQTFANSGLADPTWDGGLDPCRLDGSAAYHYGIWSGGAICWSL